MQAVLLDADVPALEAGEAAADEAADAAGELVEVTALDVAALDATALDVAAALGEATAELLAPTDADGRADTDGLTADDPSAAGEPLVPGVVPV